MLLSSSNARGTRGSSKSSRGSRGRGQTGRGASNNSSATPPPSASTTTDPFEKARLENAAKREQRGQNGTATNTRGRGSSRGGLHSNKQVRFATPPIEEQTGPPANATPSDMNNSFGTGTATLSNPFSFTTNTNTNTSTNVFGAPTGPKSSSSSPFAPSSSSNSPNTNVFGSASAAQPTALNPFASSNAFGTTSPSSNFGTPSSGSTVPLSSLVNSQNPSILKGTRGATSKQVSFEKKPEKPAPQNALKKPLQANNGFTDKKNKASNQSKSGFENTSSTPSDMASFASSSELATKINALLQKEKINSPRCNAKNPGDPREKAAVKNYLDELKKYRARVRASLIKGGFIDDPLKPKKLSEAIDFKGTCDQMCPEEEIIRRIIEDDVQRAEKEQAPDGSMRPSPQMMIKKLARSAAGEDAPLPQDVRSPAALRRTLDYLIDIVLGEDDNLAAQHEFLWDRTRAIRRDFVFQSSMSPPELADQVYCLEKITRFHVTALHQMSKPDVAPENFVEQQEVEQLSKSLLSLIHAYEDCNLQNIPCENEAEFRAYYVLLNSSNPGILETVQNWGWKFWGESEQIKIAVGLVECLQNIWSPRGPLQPFSLLNVAENAFSRFFTILKGENVSYTMACFAEMHFNEVRKNALKTILSAYQRQRDQPKDWNIAKLNQYLHFDDPWEIVDFGEAYSLRFDDLDDDPCLSLALDNQVVDPFPPIKQPHSVEVVERKRAGHTLTEVIDTTVYERVSATTTQGEESSSDDGLFVKDNIRGPFNMGGVNSFSPASTFSQPSKSLGFPVAQTPPQQAFATSPATPLFGFPSASQANTTQPATKPSSEKPKDANAPSSLFAPPAPVAASTPFASHNPFAATPTNTPPPQSKAEEPAKFTWPSDNGASPKLPQTSTDPPNFSWPSDNPASSSLPRTTPTESPKLSQSSAIKTPAPPAPAPQITEPKFNDWSSNFKPVPQSMSSEPVAQSSASETAKATPSVPVPQPDLNNLFKPAVKETPQPVIHIPAPEVSPLDNFAKWIALGEDGIVEQFMTYTVQTLVQETMENFMKEEAKKARKEAKRIAEEEEELARKEADEFRRNAVAVKYFNIWRVNAHNLWVRRQGSKARRARIEHAESMRASRAALSANVVDDFRVSISKGKKRVKNSPSKGRRPSLGSLLQGTGVLEGVHNPQDEIREIVYNGHTEHGNKRFKSSVSSIASDSSSNTHTRSQYDNSLQRTLLSDPSFLNGGSRIHLLPTYQAENETRSQLSGVQTDYFRLKARGISTLPNGTPLATSVAKDPLRQKQSFEDSGKPIRLRRQMVPKEQSIPRSSPARETAQQLLLPAPTGDEDIQRLKERARAVMAVDSGTKRGLVDDDDDELFERAKRIRERMDKDSEWLRREVDRYSESRSGSWS
ncbi:putative leucine permease transcriptional regulator protein [Botrytis fragariae]|uniref:Putative leucine permease transcriptional regulator protein n=1 Tax=Botrytis fragariae TaxID=1964551 RepID=A0A8H6APQ7_9HELO|nr:putative leucine permease transcriptional regulator protein [Botrytis fragariae]KAF5871281.1 putative leucine permease transcriptional regulator protein [Botrytis fragariae]